MNLDALANRVEAAGLGTLGTSLFLHIMPDDCTAGIVFVGKPTGSPVDPEIPGYRPGAGFQVVVRHGNHSNGFALIRQIVDLLVMEKTAMAGMFVNYIRPRHEPVVTPKVALNLLEFSVNFDANYVVL